MAKIWVLDTETKGTGAHMVPLEKVLDEAPPEERPKTPRPRARPSTGAPGVRRPPKRDGPVQTSSTPLPPGHVRKKATGEVGRVRSVDPRAGTASVHWLKQGRTSTVALSAISRN